MEYRSGSGEVHRRLEQARVGEQVKTDQLPAERRATEEEASLLGERDTGEVRP
jgi:hypothetical protein